MLSQEYSCPYGGNNMKNQLKNYENRNLDII